MIALLLLSLTALANPSVLYYGPTSQEGVLTFSASVDLHSKHAPTDEDARKQIALQYFYMLGNLRTGAEGLPAIPSKTYEIDDLSIASMGGDLYRISYSSISNIALDKDQQTGNLKFDLPRDPVYMATLDQSCNNDKSEANWYEFNPHLLGCPLVKGKDYFVVTGHVDVHQNTVETYPEYSKLVGDDGAIHMSVFMNYEITHEDGFIRKLKHDGFKRHTWTDNEITSFLGFKPTEFPNVDAFIKQGGAHPIKILLFYGNANIESPKSKAFHYFYKNALETANVVIYSGHSGLSRNLNLPLLESQENFKITLKPSYQLYLLDGCITYGYYADMYLARKASADDPRGTKNLDILTFGTPAPGYDDKPQFTLSDALFDYGANSTETSYQSIANQITYSWFGVVGDEDNPSPKQN